MSPRTAHNVFCETQVDRIARIVPGQQTPVRPVQVKAQSAWTGKAPDFRQQRLRHHAQLRLAWCVGSRSAR